MTHDAPRLSNDIRHYSRLMLLLPLLACHTAASGQDVVAACLSDHCIWVSGLRVFQKPKFKKRINPDVTCV